MSFRVEDTVRITDGEHTDKIGTVAIIERVPRGHPPAIQTGILVKISDENIAVWCDDNDLTLIAPRPE